MEPELKMYREILEKFCKVFDLKMNIRDELCENAQSSQTRIYIVKTFKIHGAEKFKHPIWFSNKVGRYNISTSSPTIESACKKYIENFLLDEKKMIRVYMHGEEDPSFPYDRLENADLNFPRSSLEALVMFLDMVDTDGNV